MNEHLHHLPISVLLLKKLSPCQWASPGPL